LVIIITTINYQSKPSLSEALAANLIDENLASICSWALISNTLLAPLLFGAALRRREHARAPIDALDIEFVSCRSEY
jgi:hypothetical protein